MKKIVALVLAVLTILLCPACQISRVSPEVQYYSEVGGGKYPYLTVYDRDMRIVFNLSYQGLISAWSENGHICDIDLDKGQVYQSGQIDDMLVQMDYYTSIDKVGSLIIRTSKKDANGEKILLETAKIVNPSITEEELTAIKNKLTPVIYELNEIEEAYIILDNIYYRAGRAGIFLTLSIQPMPYSPIHSGGVNRVNGPKES